MIGESLSDRTNFLPKGAGIVKLTPPLKEAITGDVVKGVGPDRVEGLIIVNIPGVPFVISQRPPGRKPDISSLTTAELH